MNELTLSTDIKQIELEIKGGKNLDLSQISTCELVEELSKRSNVQTFKECGLWKQTNVEVTNKYVNKNREVKLPLNYYALIIGMEDAK